MLSRSPLYFKIELAPVPVSISFLCYISSMIERLNRASSSVEKLPLARVVLEKPEQCATCGEMLPSGETALKETRLPESRERMSKKEKKAARTFSFYHSRCVPREESLPSGEDIFDKGFRLPGSFESGKGGR